MIEIFHAVCLLVGGGALKGQVKDPQKMLWAMYKIFIDYSGVGICS